MYRLSLIISLMASMLFAHAQNPHGEGFKVDCNTCHTPDGWKVSVDDILFNHDTTNFSLTGQHQSISCMDCHKTLEFPEVSQACASCHTDVHAMTVGDDCMRCHSTESWLVDNIPELHEQNGFPLFGAHDLISCTDCHEAGNNLQWNRLGGECIECHMTDFNQTTNPNHIESGFDTDCITCHLPTEDQWSGGNSHQFFPLTKGHDIANCFDCHISPTFDGITDDCVNCHLDAYNSTSNPNHQTSGFNTDCVLCHTTAPGWSPASYRQHDSDFFPIYSGEHRGEWNSCFDCHVTESDYSIFNCLECHEHRQSKMDDEHRGEVRNYVYESNACYSCHPDGKEDD